MAPTSAVVPHEEESLVAAARSGDRAAFELLVTPYHLPLLRYLTRLTGDANLGHDLVQDTLLRVFERLDQLGDDRAFAAWVYRIANNRFKMDQRRRRLRRFVSLEWLIEREAESTMTALQVPGLGEGLHERELVRAVLRELRPGSRQALLLHSEAGLVASDVAQVLGISRAAAERRISRAKAHFRRRYLALAVGQDDARL